MTQWQGMVKIAVYRKLMKLSSQSRLHFSVGQIVNLVAVDAQKIMDFFWNPHDVWAGTHASKNLFTSPLLTRFCFFLAFSSTTLGGWKYHCLILCSWQNR